MYYITKKIVFSGFYGIIKNMKKTVKKIKCQICHEIFSSAGFGNHLKNSHKISVDEYVSVHGEYRINKLKANKILENSRLKFKCVLDDDNILYTERALTFHLKKCHGLTKREYIIKYLNNGIPPCCKCGCGTPTKITSYNPPFARDYISGHNVIGHRNPMSKGHTLESKLKMKQSALKRVEVNKGKLPYHSKEAIKKRAKKYSSTMLERRIKSNNVELISSQKELDNKIFKFQCKKCNNIQSDTGFSFFVCEKCFPKVRSKYELEFKEFFEKNCIDYENNVRKVVDNKFELDFYFPKEQLALEFNGLYYHGELSNNKNKDYHLLKTNYCKQKGINLIHVFEDEWINKKDIVKSKILYKFKHESLKKLSARKCSVKEISYSDCADFLISNHLQGKDKSSIRIGLFYNNILVSVMTFGKTSVSKGRKSEKNVYELSRFCSLKYHTVAGAYSRLFSYFIKNYDFNKIITYSDKRWSFHDNMYLKSGWDFLGETPPNYWYMDKQHTQRKHRFNFTKHIIVEKMNGDVNLTEWENMKKMGFDRIWDCGHFKYEYKKRDTD